jgi:TRAP-type C4-dicarboxylate transport system substrate-binding protein
MAVNQRSLDALTSAQRDALVGIARRREPEFWDIAGRDDAEKLTILEQNGMTTVEPSPDLVAAMRARASPVVQAFLASVPEAVPLIREFLARVGRPMASA